jgi:hypothetical protein
MAELMPAVWAAMADDPVKAEITVTSLMAAPQVDGLLGPREAEDFVSGILVDEAVENWAPEGAALLRLLMALGSPRVKRTAGTALEEMTRAGIFPPEWVNNLGKAVPVQARRVYDVFGDAENVAVTFRYGEAEHAIMARVDLTGRPVATFGTVSSTPAPLLEALGGDDEPLERGEPIGLAEARRRLETPLARCGEEPGEPPSIVTLMCLPILRARMRRLPAGAPGIPELADADRAAAVDEFMTSPQAAEAAAADPGATRFWAEVFADYSARTHGAPPAQVGPRRLARILLEHVPAAVVLSPAQRRHLEPAVSAWLRWSARVRGLDEAATARLAEALTETLAGFDDAYDNPGMTAGRTALADWDARTGR